VGTVEEATNRLKLPTSTNRASDSANRWAVTESKGSPFGSERRAGLENDPCGCRPCGHSGKAAAVAVQGPSKAPNNPRRRVRRGSGDGTSARKTTQHGRPARVTRERQPAAREGGPGRGGSRIGP